VIPVGGGKGQGVAMNDLFRRFLFPVLVHVILLNLSLLCAKDTPLSTAELSTLLNTVEKNLSSIKTLRATFDQTKRLALFDEELSAKGAICFSNPGKIRFEIHSPFRSVLLVSGKKIAKYEHGKHGWKRLELKNADGLVLVMQQIGDWMKGDFRSQSRIFAVTAVNRGGKTYIVLKSKPKRFAKFIERIEIALAADRSRFESITIREPGGDYTVMAFTKETRGPSFPSGVFDTGKTKPVEVKGDAK
jgi:outer membrane lipoprotein-sorting protein